MEKYFRQLIEPRNDLEVFLSFWVDGGTSKGIPHFHDWIEIVYLLTGTLIFYIEDKEYHLKKGQFIVVDPMSIHNSESLQGNTAILLQIPMSFLEQFDADIRKYKIEIDYEVQDPIKKEELNRLGYVLQELIAVSEMKKQGYIFRCYQLIFELLNIVYSSFAVKLPEQEQKKYYKNRERIEEIIAYVEKHYKEQITIKQMAEQVNISEIYFTRFFKKMMGITFIQYLNQVRLQQVQKDLLYTDYSIQYILDKNGFYNYKLFMRIFKERFQCTPKQYRKKTGKNKLQ